MQPPLRIYQEPSAACAEVALPTPITPIATTASAAAEARFLVLVNRMESSGSSVPPRAGAGAHPKLSSRQHGTQLIEQNLDTPGRRWTAPAPA
ncbi:hypothetical protein GCM10010502_56440 [Kitasatospora aureofaciens]|uniref:Uncharacterized protein n=1 Tax=Kitasatospora aureofaciens TaxID=1894 RepID=A0A8H9LT79_KITAU|nr:hypothetical protein GCM10010502_56440 [Kitasatospora aureofaciens]